LSINKTAIPANSNTSTAKYCNMYSCNVHSRMLDQSQSIVWVSSGKSAINSDVQYCFEQSAERGLKHDCAWLLPSWKQCCDWYFRCELCTSSIHFLFDGLQKCKHSVNTKLKEEEIRKQNPLSFLKTFSTRDPHPSYFDLFLVINATFSNIVATRF